MNTLHLLFAAELLLWAAAALYALWIFYAAVMGLKHAKLKGPLNKPLTVLGTPVLVGGYLLDAALNIVVMTVVCLEMPQELTISARLKRYNRDPRECWWRRKVAAIFEPILDPLDPSGDHI